MIDTPMRRVFIVTLTLAFAYCVNWMLGIHHVVARTLQRTYVVHQVSVYALMLFVWCLWFAKAKRAKFGRPGTFLLAGVVFGYGAEFLSQFACASSVGRFGAHLNEIISGNVQSIKIMFLGPIIGAEWIASVLVSIALLLVQRWENRLRVKIPI